MSKRRRLRRWFAVVVAIGLVAAGAIMWTSWRERPPREASAVPPETGDKGGEAPNGQEATETRHGAWLAALPSSEADEVVAAADLPRTHWARAAAIAPEWLDRKASPFFDLPQEGRLVPLELAPGEVVPVRLRRSEVLGQERHLVRGEIDGIPDSRFLLTIAGDAVAFSVVVGADQRFAAIPAGAGRVVMYAIDATGAPPCAMPLPAIPDGDALAQNQARSFAERSGAARVAPVGESGEPAMPIPAGAAPSSTAVVDVLVAYTPEVLSSATPDSALIARIDLAFAEANDEYERSETRVRVRLVGLRQTQYTETGDNADTLDRLRQTTDGHMDELHAARDELGADLVCLIVRRTDAANIGIAYLLNTLGEPERQFNDLFGFSVVQHSWVIGSSTFSHEVGHNLGCSHDRQNASSAGVFPFSYGYRFTGADNRTYRTIMAYQPGTSVPYFSNPRLTHPVAQRALGVEAGLSGEADNATTINRTAWFVASYRSNRADPPARGRLHNVSTRAWVGSGDNALIGGFYVGAPGSKWVLVRVRGPQLAQFGVPDPLLDPAFELISVTTHQTVAANNDWGTAPNASAIVDTGLAPTDPREPAALVLLDPGGYTAVARGANDTTGVALMEVFEVDTSGPKLVNLSTRGFVDTGDRVMIGGVIVNGNPGETKRLLFRALGPSLADFGVANPLFDPAMRLYNESGEELLDNDDWDFLNDTMQAQVQALNLAPTVRREPVMLVDLPPGLYTLIVRPFENEEGTESGVGLIEAYDITTP